MKKLLIVSLALLLAGSVYAYTSEMGEVVSLSERNQHRGIEGWSVCVKDVDIDNSAELVTALPTTYAQLAAEDEIELVSSVTTDTVTAVDIYGVNSSGDRVSENLQCDSSDSSTVATSSTTWRYIDQVIATGEAAGTLTIQRQTGDTFITSIQLNQTLDAGMAQHVNGEKYSYVTSWSAGVPASTDSVEFQLRWYPDDADCLDASDGFVILDLLDIGGRSSSDAPKNVVKTYDAPIRLRPGGWLAVYASADTVNSVGYTRLTGFDK